MWYIYDIYFTKILFILLDYPKHDNFDIKWHNPSGQNRQKKECRSVFLTTWHCILSA